MCSWVIVLEGPIQKKHNNTYMKIKGNITLSASRWQKKEFVYPNFFLVLVPAMIPNNFSMTAQ